MTTVRLPAAPSSAALIRHHIAADLAQFTMSPGLIDDVLLVASELVTNSIRHAQPLPDGKVSVTWDVDSSGVIVRVTDGGAPSHPRVRHPSADDVSGRGLALVEAVASGWGVEDAEDVTTVWARVSV